MPNPVNGVNLHDPRMDPLWAEAERLGVPICFHPAPNNYSDTHFVNRYLSAPSTTIAGGLNNPIELMAAVASMTAGGVLERFPRLRVAFLEGNCSWLPWLLWRLDEYWEMAKSWVRRRSCRRCAQRVLPPPVLHQRRPRRGPGRVGVPRSSATTTLVFSTDSSALGLALSRRRPNIFLKLPLSEVSKKKILWDNCARLYNLS